MERWRYIYIKERKDVKIIIIFKIIIIIKANRHRVSKASTTARRLDVGTDFVSRGDIFTREAGLSRQAGDM